jgi:hypothetical protein
MQSILPVRVFIGRKLSLELIKNAFQRSGPCAKAEVLRIVQRA